MRIPFTVLIFLLATNPLPAQDPSILSASTPSGSISGSIVYSPTGAPGPDADVSARAAGVRVEAKTDAQGHYVLKGIRPGVVTVSASMDQPQGFPLHASRRVQLSQAQDLASVDMKLAIPPQIKGRVIDQNKEPVPDMEVMLVAREYSHGALRYIFTGATQSDDQGNFTLSRFEPGRAFIVLARPRPAHASPVSDLPTNPAMRKRLPAPTFYPGAISVEGAQAVTLGDGEIREGLDIPVIRAPSLCIEGHTLAGRAPAALNFDISTETPAFGQSGNGGMYGTGMFYGKTGPGGVIRACGLTPGTWAIHVDQPGAGFRDPPAFFGTATFTLTDSDLHDVVIAASPRVNLPVEVTLDGPAPAATPNNPKPIPDLIVLLQSLVYAQHTGDSGNNKVSVPGSLSLEGLLADNYSLTIRGLAPGMYIESATYGNADVLRHTIPLGSSADNTPLRIVIGENGGRIQVAATDKDSNPTDNTFITVFPADAITEADVAVTYTAGTTDQTGTWKSGVIAPGTYYVIATPTPSDRSPEAIGKLLRARTRADPVVVTPGGTANAAVVERTLQ
jgi:hypothetical protein